MKNELIRKLDNFTINCNLNFLISNIIDLENGKFVYSENIEDSFWNFISNINVESKEDFNKVWKINRQLMLNKERTPTLYITPNSNLINNYKEILPKYMKIESEEIWMLFTDFESLNDYENNTDLDLKITTSNNLTKFADVFMKSYSTVSEEDPYGEMPEYYRTAVLNYKNNNDTYNKTFYTISINNIDVSCAMTIVKDDIALIGFVGTIKDYRGKGICKNLMNKILNDLKQNNVKFAYLQTEKGFIPEKLYSKLGFQTVCKAIIAVEDITLYHENKIFK